MWFFNRSTAKVHAPSLSEMKRLEESSFQGFYKTRRGFYLNVSHFYHKKVKRLPHRYASLHESFDFLHEFHEGNHSLSVSEA